MNDPLPLRRRASNRAAIGSEPDPAFGRPSSHAVAVVDASDLET